MGQLHFIERGDFIELGAAVVTGNARRVVQVEHGVVTTAQEHALVVGGQETTAPEAGEDRLARVLAIALGEQHDVGGHVLVITAKTVAGPGSGTGLAGDLRAGVNQGNTGVMVDGLGVHGAHHGDVINNTGGIGQQVTHPGATLAMLGEVTQ